MKTVPSCAAVITGGVSSMLIPLTVTLAPLPARSVATPVADWSLPSLVRAISGVHEATPESRSEQPKCTVTVALFHPAELGPGVLEAFIAGAALSMLIPLTVFDDMLPEPSMQ